MNRTPESDHLLNIIQGLVKGKVPPNQEMLVMETTAKALVAIMNDPNLYSHLRVVMDLQQENWALRQQILHLQRLLSAYTNPGNRQVKVQVQKAPPAKKAVAKKRPAKRAPSNVHAFKRGLSGR